MDIKEWIKTNRIPIFLSIILFLLIFIYFYTGDQFDPDFWKPRNTTVYKTGIVTEIEYDQPFGGTFSDYMDIIMFDDGTCYCTQYQDLSRIKIGVTGIYQFKEDFFTYNGHEYRFYDLENIKYVKKQIR